MKCIEKFFSLLLSALLLIFAVSCQNSRGVDTLSLADKIKECSGSEIDWIELSENQITNYFSFKSSVLESQSVFMNSSENDYDLIAVVELKDKSDLKYVLEGFSSGITSAAADYQNYGISAYKKMQNFLLYKKGNTVIAVVSNNYDGVKSILQEIGAEAV